MVARWCADLLLGRVGFADPERPSLAWLGGVPAAHHLQRAAAGDPEPEHWVRVWAARGLLYVWHPEAEAGVLAGLSDPQWRVREMAAKVVRLRQPGAAADPLVLLCSDAVPRVRVAALRALAVVGEAEHAPAVLAARSDAVASVARTAEEALDRLACRLDRPLD